MNKNNKFMTVIFSIFIILFSFAVTPLEFQNDTFYTIKIGEKIDTDGIDMKDPFSIHENLDYTYPHWLYDFATYKVYALGGFKAVYIATGILSSILGLTIFLCNKKLCKNSIVSLIVSLFTIFLLRGFLTARAQLVTFILFALEYYLIERFVDKKKIIYAIFLFIISILIVNIHSAVWPFFFILFLPHIGTQLWMWLTDKLYIDNSIVKAYEKEIKQLKKKDSSSERIKELEEKMKIEIANRDARIKARMQSRENPYKIVADLNNNSFYLILVMLLCILAGFICPLGPNVPFTYLIRTIIGNTTHYISEHLPVVLVKRPTLIIFSVIFGWLFLFKDLKLRLSDFFLVGGLSLLTIFSGRQESMLILLGSFPLARLIKEYLIPNEEIDKKINNFISSHKKVYIYAGILLTFMTLPSITNNLQSRFIDYTVYPVDATTYIKKNLDVNNIRLFNEYNFGSYLLLNDIPVFIDSRADLYAPEFNSKCTVFTDYMKVHTMKIYPETIFEKYNITHIILSNDSIIHTVVDGSGMYNKIYTDDYFSIYERN